MTALQQMMDILWMGCPAIEMNKGEMYPCKPWVVALHCSTPG